MKSKAARRKPAKDGSTEERIKEAAKRLFTKKGYAAVKTRDIAAEAGINLALLNYYFRSKEKLFDIIMLENFSKFIQAITVKIVDGEATVEEKIGKVVNDYIDFLTLNPDLPLFILNEIRANPSKIASKINEESAPMRAHFMKALQESMKQGNMKPLDQFHFMANLIGLTVFPFVARPILQKVTNVSDEQFNAYMQERKKLVPLWIKTILKTG